MMMASGLLLALTVFAVGKLNLQEITSGAFRGESLAAVQPMADGETYAQLERDGHRVVQYSMRTGREVQTLFDVATIPAAKHIDDYTLSPDGRYMLVQTHTKSIYRHSLTAEFYVYDRVDGHLAPLSANGPQQTPVFSPDGRQIAFVRDNNIFLAQPFAGSEVQVTTDGRRNEIINGIPDWVNEEEFGIDRALVFTADGSHLVWVRYDERRVPEYSMPLFKGLRPERKEYADYPGAYVYKYPIAGAENATVTVWSYDIKGGQTQQLRVFLDADGYIPRIVATADATKVVVMTLNRHQDCLCLYKVDAQTASSRLIIEENVPKYVREESYSNIHITQRHILLPSDRTGWMHLYLYDLDGRLLRQIDDGEYEVSQVYGYDERTGNTYFAAHADGATDQRVWQVSAKGRRTCLTPKPGWNTAIFSAGYQYFINTWSNLNTPPVYTLCDKAGRVVQTLIDNHALTEKLSAYDLGRRELFTLTTAEGVTLNGWLIKPHDFDPSRRYPVVMYQYGGPGNQQVADRWQVGMSGQGAILEQLLCQQGYVCVCVDGRGTGGRGADFEKCTYLKLGQLEARDQVETALWLQRQPFVDPARIAIWGWSFGGFNTLMAMSEGRPAFRCGIAIAPPTSWRYYDTIYTERFMRTPQENPTGYDECPLSRAPQLSGALLLCHGMADDNVHFRNTAEYTEALVQADKDFRQLVYTNRNHSIYGGNTRHHLFRQCLDFFQEAMK